MPDTGVQQPLPFPPYATMTSPPEMPESLAAEGLRVRQNVAALQRLQAYQGSSSNDLRVILTLQAEQIRGLEAYVAALEAALGKLSLRAARRRRPHR